MRISNAIFSATVVALSLFSYTPNAAASETVHVFKYDGTLQCGMGKEVPLGEMAKELASVGVTVMAKEKRIVPVLIPAVCGAPTGWANVYEIASSDLKKVPLGTGEKAAFAIWLFDYKTVFVYKYDGTLQCGMGREIPLEEMESELKASGVQPVSSRKSKDGLMHIALCGASTGQINVYEVMALDYPKASSLGFQFLVANLDKETIAAMGLISPKDAKVRDVFPFPW